MSREIYLQWAANCRRLAADAETEELRSAWLSLATSWLEMAAANNGWLEAETPSSADSAGPKEDFASTARYRHRDEDVRASMRQPRWLARRD
jgi:hypothetical protein